MAEEAVEQGMAQLTANDFYRQNHRLIFEAISALSHRNSPIDLVTVVEELRRNGQLDRVGGPAYLTALIESCPAASHIETYASHVSEAAQRREAISCAERLGTLASSEAALEELWKEWENARDIEQRGLGISASRFQLIPLLELKARPKRPWLIEGIMPINCIGGLMGAYGTFKSFIALDMALSVATGIDWHGHQTKMGPTVYVAGEGCDGIPKRCEAWQIHHQSECPEHFYVVENAPQLTQPKDVTELLRQVKSLPTMPHMMILDTLARCNVGGDENSSAEMGEVIEGAERIRRETGAAVLIIHHFGWAARSRGSTALPSGIEVKIDITARGDHLKLTCDKQKDDAPFMPLHLIKKVIPIGPETTSLVFVDGEGAPNEMLPKSQLTKPQQVALDVLKQLGRAGWVKWKKACFDAGIPDGTFRACPKILVDKGFVVQNREMKEYEVCEGMKQV